MFFVWQKLPLSLKLIVPLVVMQLIAMCLGIIWFGSWLENARLNEADHILDSQADAFEDSIEATLKFDQTKEIVRELYRDKTYYFALVDRQGRILQESQGPTEEERQVFHTAVINSFPLQKKVAPLIIFDEPWRLIGEPIKPKFLSTSQQEIFLFSATNVKSVIKEVNFVKRTLSFGVLILLFLTCGGTILIVSHTTTNLKNFAHSIGRVLPRRPEWKLAFGPKSAEENLLFSSFEKMILKIKKVSEAQRLFIANASHELKTPIAGLLMSLEVTLTKTRKPEEYERTCSALLNTVRGLKRLSTALLDLARLEELDDLKKTKIDLSLLFERLVDSWSEHAAKKNISLKVNKNFENSPSIYSNLEFLEVALGNFIDNSIKYSAPNQTVVIEAKRAEANICISIQDFGVGISDNDLKRLGEVFFRSNQARSVELSYGLGFAQAERIIKLLSASLSVFSTLGEGTTVEITLPAV